MRDFLKKISLNFPVKRVIFYDDSGKKGHFSGKSGHFSGNFSGNFFEISLLRSTQKFYFNILPCKIVFFQLLKYLKNKLP